MAPKCKKKRILMQERTIVKISPQHYHLNSETHSLVSVSPLATYPVDTDK